MPSSVQAVVFVILAVISANLGYSVGQWSAPLGVMTFAAAIVISALIASAIKVANQWQRGVVLRLGELHGTRGPGLFFIVPVIDRVRMIDTRILAHHISEQAVITRDNVPVTIDSVLFYRVTNAEDAVVKIQDFAFAVAQLAQMHCATWLAA